MAPVSLFGHELFSFVDNTVYQKHFKWNLQNIMRQEVCTKQLFWKFLVHVKILTRISCTRTIEFAVGLYWSKLNLIKTLQCIRLIPVLMELLVCVVLLGKTVKHADWYWRDRITWVPVHALPLCNEQWNKWNILTLILFAKF